MIRYLWKKLKIITTGITIRIAPAATTPQLTKTLCPIILAKPIGTVRSLGLWTNVIAKRSSFQEIMKANAAVPASPGAASGRTILTRTDNWEHPSIRAASSSAFGTLSKKPLRNHVQKGIVRNVYVKTRQNGVFKMCNAFQVRKSGKSKATNEKNCVIIRAPRNSDFPLNSNREHAYPASVEMDIVINVAKHATIRLLSIKRG